MITQAEADMWADVFQLHKDFHDPKEQKDWNALVETADKIYEKNGKAPLCKALIETVIVDIEKRGKGM